MRRSIWLAASLLMLASCDRPDAPGGAPADPSAAPPDAPSAAAGFAHEMTGDLSGYYMPLSEVRIGRWSFDHLFLGQGTDFRAWEAGDRSDTFGPVMLQFDDVTSPMVRNEIGEVHSVTARILPTTYAVTDTRVRFAGTSPELGAVVFDGRLDAGALATARRNLGDEGVVLTGTLTAAGQTVREVRLRWWMGD